MSLFKEDNPLRQLVEQLILDEVKHIEELEMYLREDGTSSSKSKSKTVAKVN